MKTKARCTSRRMETHYTQLALNTLRHCNCPECVSLAISLLVHALGGKAKVILP